jgi:hypothetical protein
VCARAGLGAHSVFVTRIGSTVINFIAFFTVLLITRFAIERKEREKEGKKERKKERKREGKKGEKERRREGKKKERGKEETEIR